MIEIKNFLNEFIEKEIKFLIKPTFDEDKKALIEKEIREKYKLSTFVNNATRSIGFSFPVSHCCKFTNTKANCSAILAGYQYENDGYLRSGNLRLLADVAGGGANNKNIYNLYQLLNIDLADADSTVYGELVRKTDVAKKIFAFGNFEELREKLLSLYDDGKPTYTDTKIKQVYAIADDSYHLLSVLTPSNILFEIKNRIRDIRFSDTTKEAKEAKKNNDYHSTGFKTINKQIDISFGGSYPHNVSQLNAINFGTAYSLSSFMPVFLDRNAEAHFEASDKRYLKISVDVINANAQSSYCTMGVPAVTAVHGFIHALQRNLISNGSNVSFNRFAMIYESLTPNLSMHKYGYSTIGRRTPAVLSPKKGEDITSGSFNLNTRCNFKLHLMLELDDSFTNDLLGDIDYLLYRMKLAGGDIISHTTVDESCIVSNFNSEDINFLNCQVLLDRKDLMIERMENSDAIDALLDNLSKHHTSEKDDDDNIFWKEKYLNKGRFIPISVGFNGITELGHAENQRDYSVKHRFAENIITLGEFRQVHNFTSIEQMLWSYEHNNNKYIVTQ